MIAAQISRVVLACSLLLAGCGSEAETAPPATGDLSLTYPMEQAGGAEVPYRLYVPSNYDAERPWPLVMVLHGFSGTADSPFDSADGQLQQLAEQHGFIIASPNGFTGKADYGANLPLPSDVGRGEDPPEMSPEQESALAEADVLNVLDLVTQDYTIDPRRTYLMGNSMGMTGVLHLAQKMPEQWCAISASGGPPWPDFPVEGIASISGALFVHGGKDDIARASDTEKLAERARGLGMDASYVLIPEGTHGDAWVTNLPQTFEFFDRHDCNAE